MISRDASFLFTLFRQKTILLAVETVIVQTNFDPVSVVGQVPWITAITTFAGVTVSTAYGVFSNTKVKIMAMNSRDVQIIQEQLESLIDRTSLQDVLNCLSGVCLGKSDHLESNWQDKASAKQWEEAYHVIDRAVVKIARLSIPQPRPGASCLLPPEPKTEAKGGNNA